jgi:hypothetical protein
MPLLALYQVIKANPLLQRKIQVIPIHHDERRGLVVLLDGRFRETINAYD